MNDNNSNPFNILGNKEAPPVYDQGLEQETPQAQLNQRIKEMVSSEKIFIFMKGTPQYPQCGFSANTVEVFNQLGKSFKTFDVLSDPSIRQGIKTFSNWPTIPQIYINGQFIGGNDIITEMYQNGELQEMVNNL